MSSIISRRQALATIVGGVAAGTLSTIQAEAAVEELVWATWDSNGHPEYVSPFKTQTGTAIKLSYISSEDAQFAALKTGAAKDWDVVNPSINGVWRYAEAKVLQPLDLTKIPNRDFMYPAFKNTPKVIGKDGATYAAPYLWGLNPIVYRTDKFSTEPTYATLFDSKYKGQLAMRDYALEGIAIAGLYVGVPRDQVFTMSDDQLVEAKKALLTQKPLLRTYWQTIGDVTNLFATNEITCAFSWRVPYDALRDKMPIAMAKPKAGVIGWCDTFAIPTSTPTSKIAAALEFGNYLLGPDYAMAIAQIGNYATTTSVIRDKLSRYKQEMIFIDDLTVMDGFLWPVAPPNYSSWLKIWNDVKAA
jgi:spermidine/putrescine-binding protein